MTYRDDNFYIRQVLQGNSAAYANLVERHKDIVFSVIKKIIHDRLEAEELAQDVFISAYKSLSQFEGKSKFSTWLYRIAYNAAISKTRKPKKIFVSIDDPFIETQFISHVSEQSENHDLEKQIDTLYKIMEKLPPEENLLLDLFYKKDLRVEEISEITGLTISNVKVKLHRIRKRIYLEFKKLFENEYAK